MLIFKMKNCMSGYYSIIFISVEFVINTKQDGKDCSFKNLIFLPRCFPKGKRRISQRGGVKDCSGRKSSLCKGPVVGGTSYILVREWGRQRAPQLTMWSLGTRVTSLSFTFPIRDFPCGPGVKNLPTNAGDMGLVPGLGICSCCGATKPMHHNYWALAP